MAIDPRTMCAYALGLALALGVLLGAGASLAQTRDPDLPAIDPQGRGRVMTHDDLTSTSNCIGNPITPLCAVETTLACFERTDGELCRIAKGLDKRPIFEDREPELRPYHYTRYRVLSAKRFGEHDLPPPHRRVFPPEAEMLWDTEDRRRYQPGDVQIVILPQECRRDLNKCNPVWNTDRITFHLRRIGENWAVLTWYSLDWRYDKFERTREKF